MKNDNGFGFFPQVFLICIFYLCTLYADATVIQAGGPNYPLTIDSAIFTAYDHTSTTSDSISFHMPLSLYEDLRYAIDSTFSYADALRMNRKELLYYANATKSGSCLTFTCLGLAALKLVFKDHNFKSCKLVTGTDKYPFVVVFTKGFSNKLAIIIKKQMVSKQK